MRFFIFIAVFFYSCNVTAQVAQISASGTTIYSQDGSSYIPNAAAQQSETPRNTKQKSVFATQPTSSVQKTSSSEIKQNLRGSLRNTGNQKTARNIMIVNEVAAYKLGDEQLAKSYDELQSNREYQEKMQKITNKLKNDKIRNSKNREIIRILDDAGERIYNLLAY